MKLLDLQKERLTIRKKDPVRSSVLGTIIDLAKKIAKEENREVEDKDIELSAKRTNKALNKVVNDVMREMGIRKNDAMLARYILEIKVTEEFIPKTLTEVETKTIILTIIENLPEDQRNIGRVMGMIKKDYKDSIDGRLASGIIKGVL